MVLMEIKKYAIDNFLGRECTIEEYNQVCQKIRDYRWGWVKMNQSTKKLGG
jgi:hypothetical protein